MAFLPNKRSKNQQESEEKKQKQSKPRKRMSIPPKQQETPVDQDLSEINLSEDQNSIEQLTELVKILLNEIKKLNEESWKLEARLIKQEREMDAYWDIQTDCSQQIQQMKLDSQSQLIKQTECAQQPEPIAILGQNQIQEQFQNNQQGCQMEIEKRPKIYQNTMKSRKCYYCKKKGHQYKQCRNVYVFKNEFNQRVKRLTERIYITERGSIYQIKEISAKRIVARQIDERWREKRNTRFKTRKKRNETINFSFYSPDYSGWKEGNW